MNDDKITYSKAQFKELTGRRFGKLVVSHRDTTKGLSPVRWVCECDCGKVKTIDGSSLKRGISRSCGCLRVEKMASRNTTHGASRTPLYKLWKSMIARCKNPKATSYKNYGGRGIQVCNRWNVFALFKQDMGERPQGTCLERRDNDGPYSPDNCYWLPRNRQMRNTRRSVKLTINGEIKSLVEWAEYLNVPYYTIVSRWQKRWSPNEIVFGRPDIGRNSLTGRTH